MPQLPAVDCTLSHLHHHLLSGSLCLACCFPPSPPVALAIQLQTSNYRLSMGTGRELCHLINKVSLSRQNSLMKMTLMKDVCFSCHCHRDPKEAVVQLLFMHYKNVISRLEGLCPDAGLGQWGKRSECSVQFLFPLRHCLWSLAKLNI